MGALLVAENLSLAINDTPVLRGVDLAIGAGEAVAVMGPSGSGKSSLLHCLSGILRCDGGRITFDGQRVDQLTARDRADLRLRRFGYVPQFGDLVPELTLLENVALPLLLTGVRRQSALRRAAEISSSLDIGVTVNRRAGQVSGGQLQRAAVARALVHRPAVVFADEPTGALDSASGELVLEALLRLSRREGAGVVLVTHDAMVASHADREIVISDGQVVTAARRA
ncbi:ABC transporter ATP-binding protein [Actinoplanes sp. CA-030573]|uniref:ABC transporter ATP-binding protein n=1 Tax=Actinoplanes sp. CA-030573 TaxID=3239898 RepID=UPI003D8CFAED